VSNIGLTGRYCTQQCKAHLRNITFDIINKWEANLERTITLKMSKKVDSLFYDFTYDLKISCKTVQFHFNNKLD
jgi:hypothetical protein